MDSPEELTDPTPVSPRSNRHRALVGAVVGMMALAGTIIGLGAVADAADNGDPLTTLAAETEGAAAGDAEALMAVFDPDFDEEAWQAHEQCMADQLGDLRVEPDVFFSGDEPPFSENNEAVWEAADEACFDLLPQEIKDDIAAWQPYDDCIDGQVTELDVHPWVDEEQSEAEWDAVETAWQAADEACRGHLPDHVQAQMAAFDAFDQCLTDAGVFDEGFELGAVVYVETPDGFQVVEFGGTEGSVTISGTADSVTVTSKGGATVLDEAALEAQWSEIDAAHEACEQLLPYRLSGTEET